MGKFFKNRELEKIQFSSSEGKEFFLKRNHSTQAFNSFFAFSSHKSGSTLLTALLSDYCSKLKIETINISDSLFMKGIDFNNVEIICSDNFFSPKGLGFIGWRSFIPKSINVDLNNFKNILLVRDPRDRLVSLYYSLGYSHVYPKNGTVKKIAEKNRAETILFTDINQWIMNNKKFIAFFNGQLLDYHNNLPFKNTRIYRYEDIILKKTAWLTDMINFLNIDYNQKAIDSVIKKHDILPGHENIFKHIRQVYPSNYLNNFNVGTINYLNNEFKFYLEKYNYFNSNCFGNELVYAKTEIEVKKIFS